MSRKKTEWCAAGARTPATTTSRNRQRDATRSRRSDIALLLSDLIFLYFISLLISCAPSAVNGMMAAQRQNHSDLGLKWALFESRRSAHLELCLCNVHVRIKIINSVRCIPIAGHLSTFCACRRLSPVSSSPRYRISRFNKQITHKRIENSAKRANLLLVINGFGDGTRQNWKLNINVRLRSIGNSHFASCRFSPVPASTYIH